MLLLHLFLPLFFVISLFVNRPFWVVLCCCLSCYRYLCLSAHWRFVERRLLAIKCVL